MLLCGLCEDFLRIAVKHFCMKFFFLSKKYKIVNPYHDFYWFFFCVDSLKVHTVMWIMWGFHEESFKTCFYNDFSSSKKTTLILTYSSSTYLFLLATFLSHCDTSPLFFILGWSASGCSSTTGEEARALVEAMAVKMLVWSEPHTWEKE